MVDEIIEPIVHHRLGRMFETARNSPLVSGSFVSMSARVVGMIVAFGSHILLSRVLGPTAYGSYVIALGWALVFAIFARLGLDNAVLRFATIYREEGQASEFRGLKRLSLGLILAVSMGLALCLLIAKLLNAAWLEAVPPAMLLWVATLVAALACLGWYSALIRTAHRILAAQAYEQILRPALLVVAVGVVALAGITLTSSGAMMLTFAATLAALVGIALHSRKYFSQLRHGPVTFHDRNAWLSMGWMLMLMSLFQEAMNQIEIILLGVLASATDAAHFSAAARLASFVPFGLVAIVTVSAPIIASAYRRGDQVELAHVAKIAARFAFLFAMGVTVVLALIGQSALAAFGPTFVQAYPALMILLVGGLVNAFTGAVAYMLSMTVHQKAALVIVSVAMLISGVANLLLIPRFGIVGSAMASTAAVCFWNLAMLVVVRRRLGVDSSAIGLAPSRGQAMGNSKS